MGLPLAPRALLSKVVVMSCNVLSIKEKGAGREKQAGLCVPGKVKYLARQAKNAGLRSLAFKRLARRAMWFRTSAIIGAWLERLTS